MDLFLGGQEMQKCHNFKYDNHFQNDRHFQAYCN